MLFRHEHQRQLKQEIITRLASKVDELQKLHQEIEDFTPIGGVHTTTDTELQPGFLIAKDLIELDQLTQKLVSLVEDKKDLLKSSTNRKAHIRTGNLKKYIDERLPESEFKELFNLLTAKYQMLDKILEKWYKTNVNDVGNIRYENLHISCIQFNLMANPIEKSIADKINQKIPEKMDGFRKHTLEMLKIYIDAAKTLAEKNPKEVHKIYKQTQEAMEELHFKQNPLQLKK